MSLAAAVFVASVLLTLAAVSAFAWRVFGGVRSLGRTVADAASRIEAAAANLPETPAEPYTRGIPRPKDGI